MFPPTTHDLMFTFLILASGLYNQPRSHADLGLMITDPIMVTCPTTNHGHISSTDRGHMFTHPPLHVHPPTTAICHSLTMVIC